MRLKPINSFHLIGEHINKSKNCRKAYKCFTFEFFAIEKTKTNAIWSIIFVRWLRSPDVCCVFVSRLNIACLCDVSLSPSLLLSRHIDLVESLIDAYLFNGHVNCSWAIEIAVLNLPPGPKSQWFKLAKRAATTVWLALELYLDLCRLNLYEFIWLHFVLFVEFVIEDVTKAEKA